MEGADSYLLRNFQQEGHKTIQEQKEIVRKEWPIKEGKNDRPGGVWLFPRFS